jgi:hypothetical protein
MNLTPEKLASLLQSIAAFNTALKTQLGLKLGTTERAADSSKLEGKTLAQITTEIQGSTGAELDALELIVNAFIARRDNPHVVTKAQVGLDKVDNFATATGAEVVTGTAADKFVTPAGIAAFWADKVGAAPGTLDTIAEIAAALQGNPDVINQILTGLGNKLDKTGKAADTTLFDGKTLAEVIAQANDGVDLSQVLLKSDDLGASKVAVTGDAEGAGKTLKTHLEGIATDLASGVTATEAAQAAADTAQAAADAAQTDATAAGTLAATKLDATGKAVDSAKLEGKTVAEIVAQAQAGVDLGNVVQKDDDFGAYKVGAETFTQLFAGVQTDLDALEALIPEKASSQDVTDGTDDVKYVTVLGVKAAASAAIDALIDGAPDALNTLNELAVKLQDQDDAVAAIVSSLADKLGKLETAADSAKFGGKTPAQRDAERDTAITAITNPLDARIDALEEATGGGGDFLKSTSDLAVNPVSVVTVVGEEAQVLSLKAWLEGIFAAITANGTAANAAQSAADAAALLAQAGVDAAGVADGKAVTAQAAAEAAQAAADALETSKLDVTGVAADSSKLEGQTLAQILATIRGGDIQTIQAVQDALDAYIATAPVQLTKATGAEAIAGTDDAKYITALALKAKVDDAIAALVNGAPTALDTLKELADKLAEDGDALAALVTAVDGKLGKTEQAADSLKLNGKTQAELTASAAEVTAGTVTDKFVTPAALAPTLAAIGAGQSDLTDLVTQMTTAFNAAAADIDPAA